MWGQQSEVHYQGRQELKGPAGERVVKSYFSQKSFHGYELLEFYSYDLLDLNDIMNYRNSMEEIWYEDMQGNIIQNSRLCATDSIDFGKAQIGETIFEDLVLTNPYKYPLDVQIFIGTDFYRTFPKERERYARAEDIQKIVKQTVLLQQSAKNKHQLQRMIEEDVVIRAMSHTKKRLKDQAQIRTHALQLHIFCFNQEQEEYMLSTVEAMDLFTNTDRQRAISGAFLLAEITLNKVGINLEQDFQTLKPTQQCTSLMEILLKNMEKLFMVDFQPLATLQRIFGELNFSETEQKVTSVKQKLKWFVRLPTEKEKDYTITGFSFNTIHNLGRISYMDYLLYDDILKSTYTEPFLNPKHQYRLGFPDLYEAKFGWLKSAVNAITPSEILNQGRKLLDLARQALQELSLANLSERLKTPEPEVATTAEKINAFAWQYKLTDPRIQQKLQSNKLKPSQNFFLNFQSTPRIVTLPAEGTVTLTDFLVFQPQQLRLDLAKFKGQLYLKVPNQVLRVINLYGSAYANIMDVKEVFKVGSCVRFLTPLINNAVFQNSCIEPQQQEESKMPCDFYQNDSKWQTVEYEGRQLILDTKFLVQQFTSCLDPKHQQIRIAGAIYEHSRVTSSIQLTINENDVISKKERVQMMRKRAFEETLNYFFIPTQQEKEPIKWNYELDAHNTEVDRPVVSDYRLNRLNAWQGLKEQNGMLHHQTEWIVRLFNLRGGEVSLYSVMLEDPETGLLACEVDGLSVDNCNGKQLSSSDMLDLRLVYTNPFTVTQVKANLVLLSAAWSQKYEIVLDIAPNALNLCNELTNVTWVDGKTFLHLETPFHMGIAFSMLVMLFTLILQKNVMTLFEIDGYKLKGFLQGYGIQTLLFSLRGLLFLAVEILKALKYIGMLLATRLGLDQQIERLIFEWNQLELCAQAMDALYAFQDYLALENSNRQKRMRVFRQKIEIERRPVVEPKKVPRDLSFLRGLSIFPTARLPYEKPIVVAPPQIVETQPTQTVQAKNTNVAQKAQTQPAQPAQPQKPQIVREERKEEKKVAQAPAQVPAQRPPYQKFPLHTEQDIFEALERQTKTLITNETLKTYVKMSADNTAIEIHVEILRSEDTQTAVQRESKERPKELYNEVLKLHQLIEKQSAPKPAAKPERKPQPQAQKARQQESKQQTFNPPVKVQPTPAKKPAVKLDRQDCQSRQRCLSDDHPATKIASNEGSNCIDGKLIEQKDPAQDRDLDIPQQEEERPNSPSASLHQVPQDEQTHQVKESARQQAVKSTVKDTTAQPDSTKNQIQSKAEPQNLNALTNSSTEPQHQIQDPAKQQAAIKPQEATRKKKRKRNKKGKQTVEEQQPKPEPIAIEQPTETHIDEQKQIEEPCVAQESSVGKEEQRELPANQECVKMSEIQELQEDIEETKVVEKLEPVQPTEVVESVKLQKPIEYQEVAEPVKNVQTVDDEPEIVEPVQVIKNQQEEVQLVQGVDDEPEVVEPPHEVEEEMDAKSENPLRSVQDLVEVFAERAQSEVAEDDLNARMMDYGVEHAGMSYANDSSGLVVKKKKHKRGRKRNSSQGSKTSKMSEILIDNIKDLLDDEESFASTPGIPQFMTDTQGEGETIKLSKHKKTRLRKKALKEAFQSIKSIFGPTQAEPQKNPEPQPQTTFKPASQSRIFGGAYSLFDNPDGGTYYENALRQQHSDFDKTSRGETVDDDSDFEFDISAAILQSNLFDREDRKPPKKSATSKLSMWQEPDDVQPQACEDVPARSQSLFGSMMQAWQPVQQPSNFQGLPETPQQSIARLNDGGETQQPQFAFEWKQLQPSQDKFRQMQQIASKLQRSRKDDPTEER